ncbi:MAG: hypothetical protein WA139_03110 [Candidatus Aenigmatarchaeota archaeon]
MVTRYLSESWDAYKRNFWQIVGGLLIITLVMSGIIIVSALPIVAKLIGYLSASSNVQSALFQFLMDGGVQFSAALLVAGVIVALIISTALEAGFVRMLADALKGKAEIGVMISTAREKFWTIIGANVLAGVARFALFLVFIFPPFMAIMYESVYNLSNYLYAPDIGTMLWFYGGLVIYMLLVLPFTLVNQAVVVGNHNAVDSVKKSFSVVKANYLQFLGLTVLVSLIAMLVAIVPVLGSLANFFVVTPVAALAYTAFYLAKARESGRAAIGKRGTAKRNSVRGRKRTGRAKRK